MNAVYITGASSGIGRATAILFADNGWNVAATMRQPERDSGLAARPNVLPLRCDVLDPSSIRQSVDDALRAFGQIDVLVNNAGFYSAGPLESTSDELVRRLLDVNLLGPIRVAKEILPHFRRRKSGLVVNVSSVAGQISVPLQSIYHASKWGLEGFSESLRFECRPFGVSVKLVQPGVVKTDFFGRSMALAEAEFPEEIRDYSRRILRNFVHNGINGSDPADVARLVFKIANSRGNRLRHAVGKSREILSLRKWLPDGLYCRLVEAALLKPLPPLQPSPR